MRYLSVIRQKSLTERNKTDTCPLTDSKRCNNCDYIMNFSSQKVLAFPRFTTKRHLSVTY